MSKKRIERIEKLAEEEGIDAEKMDAGFGPNYMKSDDDFGKEGFRPVEELSPEIDPDF